jgi:molybdenum cofactor guanylyltransferase
MQRAGFILTGGQSSRMRTDKALLPWKQTTVVEHLAGIARAVAGSVTLVGEPGRYRHLSLPCLQDLRPGFGPLSGLEAALSTTEAAWNLILACDMPNVNPEVADRLFARAAGSNTLAVLLRDENATVHPLCAVYHRACLPAVQQALDRGQLRLTSLAESLNPAYLDINFIVRNINTPEEWAAFYSSEHQHGK